MARQSRFVFPGHPQHVIQHGNNQDVIFITKEDYQFYLEKLQDGCEKNQVWIIAVWSRGLIGCGCSRGQLGGTEYYFAGGGAGRKS